SRQREAQRKAARAAEAVDHAGCRIACPGKRRLALQPAVLKRALAGGAQPLGDARTALSRQVRALVQCLADLVGEFDFVHGRFPDAVQRLMPFARSAVAKACAAREQCVFTLPSEHPMALAVSATSSS